MDRGKKGLATLGRVSVIFTRETTFVTFCLLFCTSIPFWKRVYSKRKEFAPKGSKFFSFKVDSFPEGRQNNFAGIISLKNIAKMRPKVAPLTIKTLLPLPRRYARERSKACNK